MQGTGMVETVEHLSSPLGWIDVGVHAPLLAQKYSRQKCCKLPAIPECGRDKGRDRPIQIDAVASPLLWLGPEHQFEQFDVLPKIFVVARYFNGDMRGPVEGTARQFQVVAGK